KKGAQSRGECETQFDENRGKSTNRPAPPPVARPRGRDDLRVVGPEHGHVARVREVSRGVQKASFDSQIPLKLFKTAVPSVPPREGLSQLDKLGLLSLTPLILIAWPCPEPRNAP